MGRTQYVSNQIVLILTIRSMWKKENVDWILRLKKYNQMEREIV